MKNNEPSQSISTPTPASSHAYPPSQSSSILEPKWVSLAISIPSNASSLSHHSDDNLLNYINSSNTTRHNYSTSRHSNSFDFIKSAPSTVVSSLSSDFNTIGSRDNSQIIVQSYDALSLNTSSKRLYGNLSSSKSDDKKRLESLYSRSWYIENQKLIRGEVATHPVFDKSVSLSSSPNRKYDNDESTAIGTDGPKKWEVAFDAFLSKYRVNNANTVKYDSSSYDNIASSSVSNCNNNTTSDTIAYTDNDVDTVAFDDLVISKDVYAGTIKLQSTKKARKKDSNVKSVFATVSEILRTKSVSPPLMPGNGCDQLTAVRNPSPPVIDDVNFRMTFTDIHNNSSHYNDSASAYLGDISSATGRSSTLQSYMEGIQAKGSLNRAISLDTINASNAPYMIEMPSVDKNLKAWDINNLFAKISPTSWYLPYIIACFASDIVQIIPSLPRLYNPNDDATYAEASMTLPMIPLLKSWRCIGHVWLSKDPSWRPWECRFVVLCDNFLLECIEISSSSLVSSSTNKRSKLAIVGYAPLCGATIISSSSSPDTISISCLKESKADSKQHVFWLKGLNKNQSIVIEQELQYASKLIVDDVYKLSNTSNGTSTLGAGRYNVVKKGRRLSNSEIKKNKNSLSRGSDSVDSSAHCVDDDEFHFQQMHTSSSSSQLSISSSTDSSPSGASRLTANSTMALKLISKEFFQARVHAGKERADALVREFVAQFSVCKYSQKKAGAIADIPIVQCFGLFETIDGLSFELELMSERDLYQVLARDGPLNECDVKEIMMRIISAIDHCNCVGMAHRDIKLQNISLPDTYSDNCSSKSSSTITSAVVPLQFNAVKLADFGMAGFVGADKKLRGRCGTPGYVAPDILNAKAHEPYDMHIDLFSLGVAAYTLLCGYEPFYGHDEVALIKANKQVQYQFHSPEWDTISDDAKDFISRLLLPLASDRPSCDDARSHSWLQM